MKAVKRPRLVPLTAMALGVLASGTWNVLYTAPFGWVRISGGLVATLVLPSAIHLWSRVPVTGTTSRVVRATVMTLIAGFASIVNLAHASLLLTDHGEHPALAVIEVLAVEALVVFGSLALRSVPAPVRQTVRAGGGRLAGKDVGNHARAGSGVHQLSSLTSPPPATAPARGAWREHLPAARVKLAEHDGDATYGRAKLANDLGVTTHVARQLKAEVAKDHTTNGVHVG